MKREEWKDGWREKESEVRGGSERGGEGLFKHADLSTADYLENFFGKRIISGSVHD